MAIREYHGLIPSTMPLIDIRIEEIVDSSPEIETEIGFEYRTPKSISAVEYGSPILP